jgi:alpha-N-arabinofuranosidase
MRLISGLAAITALAALHGSAQVGTPARPVRADLTIRADQPGATISRNIYGHFAEHLGRLIYDGLWVGEGSSIPNTRGIRNDVVAALKNMSVPVLRWPGGCFADEYHWRDGIGPRPQRPKRINTNWGGVIETNAFGTHEFMDLAEQIGADPYISANVGSGSPQEMMEWIEYMTSDSDSDLANLRRRNGRAAPWKVPYVGVGNESWGCGGNMRPDYYADEYRRFATFIKNYSGNRVTKIASGSNGEDYNWTDVLMSRAARNMQGLSVHYYTLPTGDWNKKGSATGFGEAEWHATLARTLRIDELIRKHSEIMDKYDADKRVGLMVDEWGTWYDPEPGTPGSPLYQQNSLRDGVAAALNLNIFNQHADRVRMANIAQTVNVLQAVILTSGAKMLLTPTYHVFEMFKVHQGATVIPVEMAAPEYVLGQKGIPSLQASASRDQAGRIHLSIVNLDPNRAAEVSMGISASAPRAVTGRVLTAPSMTSINTFEAPETVRPAPFSGIEKRGDRFVLTLPSKSVVVLELQ